MCENVSEIFESILSDALEDLLYTLKLYYTDKERNIVTILCVIHCAVWHIFPYIIYIKLCKKWLWKLFDINLLGVKI